jgi:hypothetical protein
MRLLMVAFLVATPALFEQGLFAQARGGGRPVGGMHGPVRVTPAPAARPVSGGPVIVPYPVYFGGYYSNPYYYGSGYATAPNPADYGPAPAYYDSDPSGGQGGYPAQGYPSVIVNPNYTPETANPVLRDYSNIPAPGDAAPQDQNSAAPPVFFLIALKDHAIYPAIAYWVEDDTLNYITQQGVRNRVSLDQVDREFSTQLNKERNIDFGLPPAK